MRIRFLAVATDLGLLEELRRRPATRTVQKPERHAAAW
jgi:hypothetical protein